VRGSGAFGMRRAHPTPGFFGCVAIVRLRGTDCGCVATKGLTGGEFRSKHGETRRLLVSVALKGVRGRREGGQSSNEGSAYTGKSSTKEGRCQLERQDNTYVIRMEWEREEKAGVILGCETFRLPLSLSVPLPQSVLTANIHVYRNFPSEILLSGNPLLPIYCLSPVRL
jgi:hypothetical protein